MPASTLWRLTTPPSSRATPVVLRSGNDRKTHLGVAYQATTVAELCEVLLESMTLIARLASETSWRFLERLPARVSSRRLTKVPVWFSEGSTNRNSEGYKEQRRIPSEGMRQRIILYAAVRNYFRRIRERPTAPRPVMNNKRVEGSGTVSTVSRRVQSGCPDWRH